MGILDTILGLSGGMFGGQKTLARQGFRTDLQVAHGDTPFDTEAEVLALVAGAGVWSSIWEFTVPAQQAYHIGYGSPAQPQNQGYMWFAIVDEGTDFGVGTVRLVQMNANRTRKIVVAEVADSALHSVTATTTETAALIDKNEMYALPEKIEYPLVGEDSIIAIEYSLITAATLADAVAFKLPVTNFQ